MKANSRSLSEQVQALLDDLVDQGTSRAAIDEALEKYLEDWEAEQEARAAA